MFTEMTMGKGLWVTGLRPMGIHYSFRLRLEHWLLILSYHTDEHYLLLVCNSCSKPLTVYLNLKQSYHIDTYAGGMAVARPYGFEIDFVRNSFPGSTAWFFVIILKFIYTPIFEIKIHEKNSLTPKNFTFKARFSEKLLWPRSGFTNSVDNIWPRQRGS